MMMMTEKGCQFFISDLQKNFREMCGYLLSAAQLLQAGWESMRSKQNSSAFPLSENIVLISVYHNIFKINIFMMGFLKYSETNSCK